MQHFNASRFVEPVFRALRRRRLRHVALALVASVGLLGASVAVASAANDGPRLKLNNVAGEVVVVRGYQFPASANVDVIATFGTQSQSSTTMSETEGRFAASFLLPASYKGTVRVTAKSGTVTASSRIRISKADSGSTSTTTISGAPGAVASMTLSDPTNNTMRLTWTAPSNAGSTPVIGYKIGWTESGTGRIWDSTGAHFKYETSPLTLTGLLPGKTYTVRLTPFNSSGDGPVTIKSLATTGGAAPDAPTTSVAPPATTTAPTTAPTAPSTGGTLPKKLVAGYWQMYQGPHVSEITANAPQYNLQYAAFALGRGQNNGMVTFNPVFSTPERLKADIAASKAKGSTWLLSIGGGSETGLRLLNPTHVEQMVSTIVPIIDAYGFQGIDWDMEGGYGQWNAASAKDVSLKLKAKYGSKFVISAAPRPYEDQYRDWAVQMGPALDLFGFQFYDFPETRDTTFLRNYINSRVDQAVKMGIPPSKIMIGAITYTQYNLGWNQVTVYRDIFKEVERKYPDLRGVYIWETSLDKKENWSFAKTMGPAVRG